MNKLITALSAMLLLAMTFTLNAAKAEFRIGAAVNASGGTAKGKHTMKDNGKVTSETSVIAFSHASVFAEYAIEEAYGIAFGIEYAADVADLPTETHAIDKNTRDATTGDDGNNTSTGTFEDMITYYISVPIMDSGAYIKGGIASVDFVSKESLTTGSTYGNETVDGTVLGFGWQGTHDQFFYRLEALAMDFDDIKLTGTQVGGTSGSYNTVEGSNIQAVSGRLAVGYAF